jgi:hypothetical protein
MAILAVLAHAGGANTYATNISLFLLIPVSMNLHGVRGSK